MSECENSAPVKGREVSSKERPIGRMGSERNSLQITVAQTNANKARLDFINTFLKIIMNKGKHISHLCLGQLKQYIPVSIGHESCLRKHTIPILRLVEPAPSLSCLITTRHTHRGSRKSRDEYRNKHVNNKHNNKSKR